MKDDFFSSTIPKELMFLLIGFIIIAIFPFYIFSYPASQELEDKDNQQELINKIKEIERKIEEAQKEKIDLEVRKKIESIKKRRQEKTLTQKKEELIKKLIALQKEYEHKQLQKRRLQRKLQEKPVIANNLRSIRIAKETDKEPFYFEIIKNKIYPVNEKNYREYEQMQTMGGIIFITGIKKVLKENAHGDDFASISEPKSIFNQTLNELNPQKHYLVFILHKTSSFPLFRKARDIANKKGFATGWEPVLYEEGTLLFGGAGAEKPPIQQ